MSARTIDAIGTDLAQRFEQIRLLREETIPVLLELVRAKVHALVPDACQVTLFAQLYDTGWAYPPDGEVVCTDGTSVLWSDEVDLAVADGDCDDATGGLDGTLLADLAFEFPPSEVQDTLVIDLVHLKARLT